MTQNKFRLKSSGSKRNTKNVSIKSSSKEDDKKPTQISPMLNGKPELINGKWYYRVTSCIANKAGANVIDLSGLKRVIFDGITFKKSDEIILSSPLYDVFDLTNDHHTKEIDTPCIVEFNNCSGFVGLSASLIPVIHVNSDSRKELVIYGLKDSGLCCDFFNVTGKAEVFIIFPENVQDGFFINRVMGIGEDARLHVDAAKTTIHFLSNYNNVYSHSPNFSVLCGMNRAGHIYNYSKNGKTFLKPLRVLDDNDLNCVTFDFLLNRIQNHEFSYSFDEKGYDKYLRGQCTVKDIITDFVMTYNAAYIWNKYTKSGYIESGYLFS